jgi:DNA-binding NarL/FixJ family response regulator
LVIAEDQAIVRMGLRKLLELAPSLEVVGEASNGNEALELVETLAPDVLLLDVHMPEKNGLDVLRVLDGKGPRVVVLTTFPDHEVLIEALRLGAGGYLLKDSSFEELVQAIETVHRGESAIQPVTLSKILPGLDRLPQRSSPRPIEDLSAREKDVLRLLAAGCSNSEIAAALENAEGTIKNHVSNILAKLAVRDRTQAVLKGIEYGLF